tara:strand:- start:3250 stop:3378 length:129 start_codon:yes stop_codon:yes gene_type:complete
MMNFIRYSKLLGIKINIAYDTFEEMDGIDSVLDTEYDRGFFG